MINSRMLFQFMVLCGLLSIALNSNAEIVRQMPVIHSLNKNIDEVSQPIPNQGFKPEMFKPLKTTLPLCKAEFKENSGIGHFIRPVFIVGDNATSFHWIKKNKDRLVKANAFGLIVMAKSINSIRRLATTYPELKFYPANGDNASRFFKVKCYPVFVSSKLIEN